MSKMPRVSGYCRVSTLDQHADIQVEAIRRAARERGWHLVAEHVDAGVSGGRDRRPALDALVEQVERREVDVVVVARLDCLGRSPAHVPTLVDLYASSLAWRMPRSTAQRRRSDDPPPLRRTRRVERSGASCVRGRCRVSWVLKYVNDARPRLATGDDDGSLFLTTTGESILPDRLTQIVREWFAESGVAKKGACHVFRHTCATLMLEGGADVRYPGAPRARVARHDRDQHAGVDPCADQRAHDDAPGGEPRGPGEAAGRRA